VFDATTITTDTDDFGPGVEFEKLGSNEGFLYWDGNDVNTIVNSWQYPHPSDNTLRPFYIDESWGLFWPYTDSFSGTGVDGDPWIPTKATVTNSKVITDTNAKGYQTPTVDSNRPIYDYAPYSNLDNFVFIPIKEAKVEKSTYYDPKAEGNNLLTLTLDPAYKFGNRSVYILLAPGFQYSNEKYYFGDIGAFDIKIDGVSNWGVYGALSGKL
jgi:hypothetical protein